MVPNNIFLLGAISYGAQQNIFVGILKLWCPTKYFCREPLVMVANKIYFCREPLVMVPNKIFLLGAISNGAQPLSNIWNSPATLTMSK